LHNLHKLSTSYILIFNKFIVIASRIQVEMSTEDDFPAQALLKIADPEPGGDASVPRIVDFDTVSIR